MAWKYKKDALFVYRFDEQKRYEIWALYREWRVIHGRYAREAPEVSVQEIIDNPQWFGEAPDGFNYYLSLLQELV